MKKDELERRLLDIEWEDFEVKEAVTELPRNIWDTVSAFSNTNGGWIILGVCQKGKKFEIVGVGDPEKLEQDFVNTLRSEKFNIKIRPSCKKYEFEQGTVLGFYIPVSDRKPIYYNSVWNTFIRTASGDQKASKEEVDAMYRDQKFGTQTSKTIEHLSSAQIDPQSLQQYREYLQREDAGSPYNVLSNKDFLEKIRVVENGRLTYSGLLFLGKNDIIQREFEDFRVDYLEIPGVSYQDAGDTRYTYRIREQENLWQYFFALSYRLQGTLDLPFQMTASGFATEKHAQVGAIREALINMLMHADYFSPMKPRIRVFTDRIEFMNPGAIPQPLEKIRAGDMTLPRNPILAKLFRIVHLAENAGYGFDKMESGWLSYAGNKPSFVEGVDFTSVEFLFPGVRGGQKGGQKSGQKGGQKMVTERQAEVYHLLKDNPRVSRKDLASRLGINESALRKHLDALRDKGILEREGPDKGGRWKILLAIE